MYTTINILVMKFSHCTVEANIAVFKLWENFNVACQRVLKTSMKLPCDCVLILELFVRCSFDNFPAFR